MIGIISWLPQDEIEHNVRYWRFRSLLKDLKKLFPKEHIVVIAQDYTNEDVARINVEVDIRRYGKLGVVPARSALRQIFLDSNEEYIILYDDDSELKWHEKDAEIAGKKFIDLLKNNKYGWVSNRDFCLKNVGLRRSIVENVPHREPDKGAPDDALYFEDMMKYLGVFENWMPLLNDGFQCFIEDISICYGDKHNTWR